MKKPFLKSMFFSIVTVFAAVLTACDKTPVTPPDEGKKSDSIALEVQYVGKNEITAKVFIQSASDVSFAYVHYTAENNPEESNMEMLSDNVAGEHSVTLKNLSNNTTYLLTAYATLGNGNEIKTRTVSATTGAPVRIEFVEKTENSITVRVSVASAAQIYTKGLTYKVRSATTPAKDVLLPSETITEYKIEGLDAFTTYQIQGYAVLEGNNEAVKSDVLEVQTGSVAMDGEYQLVFAEEFNQDNEDLTKVWTFEEGSKIRNNENQFYSKSKENAFTKDGYLHIVARRDHLGSDGQTHSYTSASLRTCDSFVYCYGIVECRAKIPTGGGMWPAIWQVGNMFDWPQNGELDIMEYYREGILANAAWGGTQAWSPVWASSKTPMSHFEAKNPNWRNEFHTWRLEWTEEYLKIFLDDELLNEVDVNKTFNRGYKGDYENPYRYRCEGFGHSLWLNLAIGGNNGGTIDNSLFPAEYLIDYIRVYQRTRLPQDK